MAAKKRSERIQLIIDLARRKEDQALAQLRDTRSLVKHEQDRLIDIEHYYQEYQGDISVSGRTYKPEEFTRTREFLGKLDAALDQQKQQIALVRQRLEQDTQTWKTLRLKTEALISYQKRCRDDEQRAEDKQEQKLLDEFSARRYSTH